MNKGELSVVKTIDEYSVDIEQFMDNTLVIPIVRSMSKEVGFSEIDATMLATIASELATNILRYAKKGSISVKVVIDPTKTTRRALEIISNDNGPGIQDVDKALSDSYTTTHNSLGMGLPSVYNYMDEFYIQTSRETGTKITVRKWCDYEENRLWI